MPEKQIVYTALFYCFGEFQSVKLFSTEESALKAAAKHVHASFDQGFVTAMARNGDEEELQEFVDSMKELYAQEAYREFVECWDDWVSANEFEGPTMCNFDIEELEVDEQER